MSIYQHFRPDEREFIDRVIGWKKQVEQQFTSKLTDFLDPREQLIIKSIIGNHVDMKLQFFGGNGENERKRALIFPEYITPSKEEFNIRLYEIEYPKKFITIEHRHVLGGLMSLGINRDKFGDILTHNDRIQFYCVKEVADYIRLHLNSIGKATITLHECELDQSLPNRQLWEDWSVTTTSLRLDTIISALCRISREKSQNYITSKLVKVNWKRIEQPSFECGEEDVLSIRGFGRMKIMSIDSKTKKGKWRIIGGKQK